MARVTALWIPAWYELDQSLTVGETSLFNVMMSSPIRFATDLDKEFTEVEAQILSVHNAQIGRIIKIDTQGLTYKFYYSDNDYLQIEAEETPGSIENSDSFGQYLTDVEFQVEIDLI